MATRRRSNGFITTQDTLRAFMSKAPHHVVMVLYPGADAYDLAAAAEVLGTANNQLRREFGVNADAYTLEVVSPVPGPLHLDMGLKFLPDTVIGEDGTAKPRAAIGTLLISGGGWNAVEAALANRRLMEWIKTAALGAARVASLCSGAFLLAEAGVLDGPTTTHWAHCDRLRERYPHLDIRADNIFVKSGKVYSSAGSTAAMDLVIALIEEDLGHKVAMSVARRMVMFLKRAGGQSQFSTALLAQTAPPAVLGGVPEWILGHLDADLSVDELAARAGMSPRNFARVFLAEIGLTPARYVEQARVEKARMLMEETQLSLGAVAAKAGFDNDRQMRRAFVRWLRVMPSDYVARFRGAAADNAFIAKPGRAARKPAAAREPLPWP